MFETGQYEKSRHSRAEYPLQPYRAADDIEEMSFVFWGEHCTECSAPACYQTCDLYDRRPDGRCRRFTFGILRNKAFPSLRGYGAEISFKKWAVLVARGNTNVEPLWRLVWKERLLAATAPILNLLGKLGFLITRDERWKGLVHSIMLRFTTALHTKNKGGTKPDAFLLEVYNPGPAGIRIQLVMERCRDPKDQFVKVRQSQDRFITTCSLPAGYSRHEFDRRLFQSFVDSRAPFDVSMTPEADTSTKVVLLSADFVKYRVRKAASSKPREIKCVVWDLDDTLWDGKLVENAAVRLNDQVAGMLKVLDQRGILVSVVSKNDFDTAWQRLVEFGLSEYFVYPQINWLPKSQNLKTIADKLNIGLDTFAFIDDNPFELQEVSCSLPDVVCVNAKKIGALLEDPRFQGSTSGEAKRRRHYYKEAIVREEKEAEFGADYRKFLAHCDIKLDVMAYGPEYFERVAELVQRTNQLNFSGQKYSREQLREILDDPQLEKYVLHCEDKFGSYGVVGFSMVRRHSSAIEVRDLMLSCRVQGKLIEQAFFRHLLGHHSTNGNTTLLVNYNETQRNRPAKQVLDAMRARQSGLGESLVLDLADAAAECDFIEVRCSRE